MIIIISWQFLCSVRLLRQWWAWSQWVLPKERAPLSSRGLPSTEGTEQQSVKCWPQQSLTAAGALRYISASFRMNFGWSCGTAALRHCGTAALNRTPKETLLKFRIPLHPKVSHGDHVCLLTSHRELNWIELAICLACSRTTTTTSPASHPSASSASHAIDACPGVVERSTCELQFSQRSPMSTMSTHVHFQFFIVFLF